jgi:hypothetical protein
VNNEALIQAIERLVTVAIVAAIGAVIANITVLNNVLGSNALILIPVITAVLDAILKYIGGATMPVNAPSAGLTKPDRPHWWAV